MKITNKLILILVLVLAIIIGIYAIVGTLSRRNCSDSLITQVPSKPLEYSIMSYIPIQVKSVRADSITKYDTVFIVKPIDSTKLSKVDSNKIVSDWFKKRIYNDVIVDDSNLYFRILDTIYQNKIYSRTPTYKIYPHIYNRMEPRRNKVFVGGGPYKFLNNYGLSLGAAFLNKKDQLFTLTYDPFSEGKLLEIHTFFKIRIGKRK